MSIQKTSQRITLLVTTLCCVSVGTITFAGRQIEQRRLDMDRHNRAQLIVEKIELNRAELSDSAQGYAVSGDAYQRQTFETALDQHLPLTQRIELLRDLKLDPRTISLFEQSQQVADAMLDLERIAVAIRDRGDRNAAISMLFNRDYLDKQAAVRRSQVAVQSAMDISHDEARERLSNRATMARNAAIAGLGLTVLVVMYALLGFYRRRVIDPLMHLTNLTRKLLAGDLDVNFSRPANMKSADEIEHLREALTGFHATSIELDFQRRWQRSRMAEQRAIFDAATVGIFVLSGTSIIRCNHHLAELFDYPREKLIGMKLADLSTDQAVGDAISAGASVAEPLERPTLHTFPFLKRDGSTFWGRLSSRAIGHGEHEADIVCIIEDVTSEWMAQEKLLAAKTASDEATRAKTDFVANMSHEIRTPLNAIMGMTHLLRKSDLAPEQRNYLEKMNSASRHLLAIINDILDFSKIESGKLTLEQSQFNVEKLLSQVTTLLADKAAEKGLEFSLDLDNNAPFELVGDALRIQQILLNFCSNAIKFTEKGGVRVGCEAISQDGNSVTLRFSVEDSGFGMTEAQMAELFQSFHQADTSITRKHGGTGLGLAISRRLAGLMNGEVGASSVPGMGSTFWFIVTLEKAQGHASRLLPSPDLRGKRVLVVDDNRTTAAVLETMLSSMTFICRSVPSGEQALQAILEAERNGTPYDIVMLVWKMHDSIDGIETAQGIGKLGLAHAPRLIMITAHDSEGLMKRATAVGIESFIIKPVTPSRLFDTTMQLIGADELRSDIPSAPVEGGEAQVAPIRGARILLVEDNELNQMVARDVLRDAGMVVEIAENGAIAVDMVQADRYQLVFMDMQMPVMDGIAATIAIRELPGMSSLPIVAMTANAMHQDRDRCLAAGMNDYVSKPIEPDKLWEVLTRWINPRDVPEIRDAAAVSDTPDAGTRNASTGSAAAEDAGQPDGNRQAYAGIDGLNTEAGLKHMSGKSPLYETVLRQFAQRHGGILKDAIAALVRSDWKSAERAFHTLKGTASTIGADEIWPLAAELEQAARGSRPPSALDKRLEVLEGMVSALIAAIDSRFPPQSDIAPEANVDMGRLHSTCSALMRAVSTDDMKALGMMREHGALLRAAFPAEYPLLDQALQEFDFVAAKQVLQQACHAAGIGVDTVPA